MAIRLIAGLGNIGKEYGDTRHNAGFWFVDEVARAQGLSLTREAKFFGATAKANVTGLPVWLLEPSTFMNRSGQSVAALANFYRILPDEILIVHDELDLMPGQVKMKKGGGHAGHNGLKDIQAKLGTTDFWRIRLGIGHPRTLNLTQQVVDFVLHAPSRSDRQAIDECIEHALPCLADFAAGHMDIGVMKLHRR
jgi:peptidyl-tRNA hydrolase, PTH1 family